MFCAMIVLILWQTRAMCELYGWRPKFVSAGLDCALGERRPCVMQIAAELAYASGSAI